MAGNVLYPKFKENLLLGKIGDLSAVGTVVKTILVDTTQYTYAATHSALSDVPAGAREQTSAQLGTVAVTNGQFSAANITFPSSTGNGVLVLYVDSGTEATSWLIAYLDTGTGLPVPTNAGEVDVTWPTPIFSL